jgi:hypothetical protein
MCGPVAVIQLTEREADAEADSIVVAQIAGGAASSTSRARPTRSISSPAFSRLASGQAPERVPDAVAAPPCQHAAAGALRDAYTVTEEAPPPQPRLGSRAKLVRRPDRA